MPIIGVETYQDKHFIVIWFPGGETRPYSSPKTMDKDNKERIHYIRKSSNSVEPTDDEEKDLFNLANRIPFDDRVNHKAEMSDLNITLIDNFSEELERSQKGAERKQAILDILIENPTITQTQLMEIMNLTRKQVQKDMKELQEEGVLVREGNNRAGRWVVKEYEE